MLRTALVGAVAGLAGYCLSRRANEIAGCTKGSDEEGELQAITDAIEAYEVVRWPDGKIPGGKG